MHAVPAGCRDKPYLGNVVVTKMADAAMRCRYTSRFSTGTVWAARNDALEPAIG